MTEVVAHGSHPLRAVHLTKSKDCSRLIRRHQECIVEGDDYIVRRAHSIDQHLSAHALIQRMYADRGYRTQNAAACGPNGNSITFEASRGTQILGTLGVVLDSGKGLLADALYKPQIDIFRTRDRKVSEVSKLAIDPTYSSKELLASLFQLAHFYLHVIHHATDAFIEVHPRHARFYRRMLYFREIGEMKTCARVNAPAVLLHIDLAYMQMQIERYAGRTAGVAERSLYPYFCPMNTADDAQQRFAY